MQSLIVHCVDYKYVESVTISIARLVKGHEIRPSKNVFNFYYSLFFIVEDYKAKYYWLIVTSCFPRHLNSKKIVINHIVGPEQ